MCDLIEISFLLLLLLFVVHVFLTFVLQNVLFKRPTKGKSILRDVIKCTILRSDFNLLFYCCCYLLGCC